MTKTIPCSECGTPVTIPAKYAKATRATCLECSEAQTTSHPYGEKFAQVFKAGWYADHLKNLDRKATRNKALKFVASVGLFFAFSAAAAVFFGGIYYVWLIPAAWLWENVGQLVGAAWLVGFVYFAHRLSNR